MISVLKNLTGLDETTIINLLPFILIEIRNYTNQYFLTKYYLRVSKIEDNKIYYEGDTSNFVVGDIVELLNSYNNIILYQIKNITDDYIEVEQDLIDEINNITLIKLSFKNVNVKTIGQMLKYDVEFGNTSGIKRQSLGGYNVEFTSPVGGDTLYPLELYGGLNSLKKIDDDYAEYRRKGYVRL